MVENEGIYTLRINCKEKRTVGKAKKEINVEKYNRFKQIKIIEKRKRKMEEEKQKGKQRTTPQNCKSPMQRQRFITTIKSVTEYTHIYTPISKIKTVQQI